MVVEVHVKLEVRCSNPHQIRPKIVYQIHAQGKQKGFHPCQIEQAWIYHTLLSVGFLR